MQIIPQLGSGGAEKFCVDLCNALVRRGCDVTIVVLHDIYKENNGFFLESLDERVEVNCAKKKRGLDLAMLPKLLKLIVHYKPDCINTHLNCLLYVFPVVMLTKSYVAHTMHNVASKEQESAILRKLYKLFFQSERIVPVAISDAVKQSVCEEYGRKDVPLIENGVELPGVSGELKGIEEEVQSFKRSEKTKVFMSVARYSEQKNLSLLIKAFNRISDSGEDAVLLIIGDGPNDEREMLRSLAGDSVFLIGRRKNIGDYLSCADAMCLSSKWEGLPITVLESMAKGVVVLSTAVGGVPDVIKCGSTGFLSKDLSVSAYEDMLRKFLAQDKGSLIRMKLQLKQLFTDRFDMKITAHRYHDLYKAFSHNLNDKK